MCSVSICSDAALVAREASCGQFAARSGIGGVNIFPRQGPNTVGAPSGALPAGQDAVGGTFFEISKVERSWQSCVGEGCMTPPATLQETNSLAGFGDCRIDLGLHPWRNAGCLILIVENNLRCSNMANMCRVVLVVTSHC